MELPQRFWDKVKKTDSCWIWVAAKREGYGRFKLNGKVVTAHRLAYEWAKGPIPEEYCVCHTCDNPPCVNPDHLFTGTKKDNMRDASNKGRMSTAKSRPKLGKDNPVPRKLTEQQVKDIRRLYQDGNTSHRKLATRFHCSHTTVYSILKRKTWAWLE